MSWPTSRFTRQRGSSSLEAAIIIPVLLAMLGLLYAGAKYNHARQQLSVAAHAAARAASLERSASAGRVAAVEAARAVVDLDAYGCRPVTTVTGNWNTPLGVASEVSVTVRCTVTVGDLLLPRLPGTLALEASATSPIDRFRQRR